MRGVGRRRGYWEEMVRGEQFALPTSLDVQSMRNLGAKPLLWRVLVFSESGLVSWSCGTRSCLPHDPQPPCVKLSVNGSISLISLSVIEPASGRTPWVCSKKHIAETFILISYDKAFFSFVFYFYFFLVFLALVWFCLYFTWL